MNSRQKAKKYKKLYEELQSRMILIKPIMVKEQCKTITLKTYRIASEDEISLLPTEMLSQILIDDMKREIANKAMDYVNIIVFHDPSISSYYTAHASLRIVDERASSQFYE